MKSASLNLNREPNWNNIQQAQDQVDAYLSWCRRVMDSYDAGSLPVRAAVELIIPNEKATVISRQLEKSARVQMIMDYAFDIWEGVNDHYPDLVNRDLSRIRELIG